jgi:hypothetical protein
LPLYFYYSLPLAYIIAPLRPVVKSFFEKSQNKKQGKSPAFLLFCFFGYKLGKINSKTERLLAW